MQPKAFIDTEILISEYDRLRNTKPWGDLNYKAVSHVLEQLPSHFQIHVFLFICLCFVMLWTWDSSPFPVEVKGTIC